jgi:hypothetical protein
MMREAHFRVALASRGNEKKRQCFSAETTFLETHQNVTKSEDVSDVKSSNAVSNLNQRKTREK